MPSGCNVGHPVVEADWGDCREIFELVPLSKPRARLLVTRVTADERWV